MAVCIAKVKPIYLTLFLGFLIMVSFALVFDTVVYPTVSDCCTEKACREYNQQVRNSIRGAFGLRQLIIAWSVIFSLGYFVYFFYRRKHASFSPAWPYVIHLVAYALACLVVGSFCNSSWTAACNANKTIPLTPIYLMGTFVAIMMTCVFYFVHHQLFEKRKEFFRPLAVDEIPDDTVIIQRTRRAKNEERETIYTEETTDIDIDNETNM